jgi:preprotein translocase subunit SecD
VGVRLGGASLRIPREYGKVMNPNLKWKVVFIAIVLLLCVFGLVAQPSFPTSVTQLKDNFAQRIRLGLDLQGGTHLVLQVQVDEAVGLQADQTLNLLTTQLRDRGIRYDEIQKVSNTQLLVRNIAPENMAAFRDLIASTFTDWDRAVAPGETSSEMLTLRATAINLIRQRTMDQSEETIRRRIDALGLTEPVVAPYGQNNSELVVELPGEADPNRAKSVIQAGGQLELRRVADVTPYPSEAAALAAHGGVLPPGTELVPAKSTDPSVPPSVYLLDRTPIITGRDLRSATAQLSTDAPGTYEVSFTISTDAARRFGPFTEQNIGRPMAILLDKKVESAPVIQSRIDDSGRITGRFGQQEANDLALVLRAGALPASIQYQEERTVGPSLGADSIRHGVQASVIALLLVMVFMVIYYRLSGINAVVALLLNLLILLAALAYFGAVLTLPGIAGVILTIGMGVDSNVLIFERIREELRGGKAAASAVDLGFKRAFLTIIDTHVTTVVSAIFLFLFGTGPVKGFAVTLTIGLAANLFTAVYVSRVIFDWHLSKMQRQAELSI